MPRPIGILGGTFDPVHNAHLEIARRALDALDAGRVLWIPTGTPDYRNPPVASGIDRVAMLRLALAGEARFVVDERELRASASGYTYDTMVSLQSETPDTEFVLLMGTDQYSRLETWYRWRDLLKLCRIAAIERPGSPAPQGDAIRIAMAPLAISSSEIRARIGRGEDVSAMLPAAVLGYIRERALYQ